MLCVVLWVVIFLSLFLPHIWVITYMPLIHENAYYVQDSEWSLIHNVKLYSGDVTRFILSTPDNSTFMSNETIHSVLDVTLASNESWIPDPNWLQPVVYVKLYQDIVVYFTILFAIIITGKT